VNAGLNRLSAHSRLISMIWTKITTGPSNKSCASDRQFALQCDSFPGRWRRALLDDAFDELVEDVLFRQAL
jgi:hypothetical protein